MDEAHGLDSEDVARDDKEDGHGVMASRKGGSYKRQGGEIVSAFIAKGGFKDAVACKAMGPELMMLKVDQESSKASQSVQPSCRAQRACLWVAGSQCEEFGAYHVQTPPSHARGCLPGGRAQADLVHLAMVQESVWLDRHVWCRGRVRRVVNAKCSCGLGR